MSAASGRPYTYPGAACDIPSHLYEFSFAPNPDWSRRYAPQAEIQAYLEEVARALGRRDPDRHRGDGRPLRGRALGDRDERGPPRGRRAAHRVGHSRRRGCRRYRAWRRFAGPRSTPRAGATTSRWTAAASRSSAPAAARSRSSPRSSRIVAHVDVYQRSPGWTIPKMDFAYPQRTQRLFERFPALQRARPHGDLRLHGARHGGADEQALAAAGFRAVARRQITARSTTPSCGARSRRATRSAASGSCSPTSGIRR